MKGSSKRGSRPVATGAIERYSPERRAEFLLSNAVDVDDSRRAAAEVRKLGLDPKTVPRRKRKR